MREPVSAPSPVVLVNPLSGKLNVPHRKEASDGMKRVGHIYEQMAQWEHIVEAEAISTKRKTRNHGVRRHMNSRMSNLCEIQQMILERRMRTSEYHHDQRVSGQDKLRDIAKLHFHPSHIEHQLLTMTADRRIERALIRHTYASRKGYGQTAAALHIRDFLRKHRHEDLWYAQGDVVKYYDSIRHDLLRAYMGRLFKDRAFIDAFIEPFTRFSASGRGIPLGIRPSQTAGNIGMMRMDRFATEELKCMGYIRYLDDFTFFGHTKGEVKWKMRRIRSYLSGLGLELHEPKIRRVHDGLDMLGYVYYNTRNDMFWRRSDKRRWLRRRYGVTNARRLREIDAAAWGMLKWGNGHCRRLYQKKTGNKTINTNMAVSFKQSGIKTEERRDAHGVKFIDCARIPMQTVLDKRVQVADWARGIETRQGKGRYALKVRFMGEYYKLIVNAADIKSFIDALEKHGVTLAETVFTDKGGRMYTVDYERTSIIEVFGREVEERCGAIYYKGTNETVTFNE